MIKGVDLSHWNSIANAGPYYGSDFVIVKASEGKSYRDPMMKTHAQNAKNAGAEIGFYHYARPELNSPEEEVNNFLYQVNRYLGSCVLALDWEGEALKQPIEWARRWLDLVYEKTGIRPLFYCQYSYTDKIKTIRDGNYGLWIARYKKMKADEIEAKDKGPIAIWQYSGTGIDKDYFYGSVEQFKKYM